MLVKYACSPPCSPVSVHTSHHNLYLQQHFGWESRMRERAKTEGMPTNYSLQERIMIQGEHLLEKSTKSSAHHQHKRSNQLQEVDPHL